jgi:hypothetical protein
MRSGVNERGVSHEIGLRERGISHERSNDLPSTTMTHDAMIPMPMMIIGQTAVTNIQQHSLQ